MKRNLFLISMLFFVALSAFSQRNGGREIMREQSREVSPEQLATEQTDELNKVVALDSVQYQLVYLMNYSDIVAAQDSMKARRARMEKHRESGLHRERRPMSKEQFEKRRKMMQQRREQRNENMKKILTEQQYEKYLKYEEQQNEKRRRGAMRHGRTEGRNAGEEMSR